MSAAGRKHWSWNAHPQKCHRSLSREPVVVTHHCRKSGMCMQEEMIEGMYPYKKASLPGCVMKELKKPTENQRRTGTQW